MESRFASESLIMVSIRFDKYLCLVCYILFGKELSYQLLSAVLFDWDQIWIPPVGPNNQIRHMTLWPINLNHFTYLNTTMSFFISKYTEFRKWNTNLKINLMPRAGYFCTSTGTLFQVHHFGVWSILRGVCVIKVVCRVL